MMTEAESSLHGFYWLKNCDLGLLTNPLCLASMILCMIYFLFFTLNQFIGFFYYYVLHFKDGQNEYYKAMEDNKDETRI